MIDFVVAAWTIGKCERTFLHDVTLVASLFPLLLIMALAAALVQRP